MLDSFKKATASLFGGGEEMDRILSLPITQLRLELKTATKEKKFTQEAFEAFTAKLAGIEDLSAQIAVAKKAALERKVENELDIELNTPAKQLLWAAVLARMMDAGKEPVVRSELWKQLQGTIGLHNEAIGVSKVLSASLQNDDVTFDWGGPGSWFYHDPIKNHINLDLYYMLLTGFEHVRAVHLHEIGHSELSDGSYPPRMQELYKVVEKLVDPRTVSDDAAPPQKKTKKDQKKLALEVAEWKLWHQAWNSMEDICVDQFAIDMKHKLPQDTGYSLNHVAMILRGYSEILRGDDEKMPVKVKTDQAPDGGDGSITDTISKGQPEDDREKRLKALIALMTNPLDDKNIAAIKKGDISVELAHRMYNMVTRASLLAGYEKNGLFSNKDANWERFRVYPDDLRKTVDMSKVPDAKGRDAFQYLCDLSAGLNDSIRVSQPQPIDRLIAKPPHESAEDSYRAVVAEMAAKRAAIMGQIWDVFIKPYAEVLMKEFERQVEKRLDQKNQKPQNGQQGQQNQQGGQQGQQQGQQGQQGGEGQQEGSGSGGQGEKDPSQGSQKDQKSGTGNNSQGGGNGPQQSEPGEQNGFPDDPSQGGGMPGEDGEGDGNGAPEQDPQAGGGDGDPEGDPEEDPSNGGGAEPDDGEPQELDEDLKNEIGGMAKTPKEKEELDNKNDQKANAAGNDNDAGDKGPDGKDAEGRGGPGWDQDPEEGEPKNPKKVGDLRNKDVIDENMTDEQKQAMKEAAKNMPKSKPGDLSSQGGNNRGVDLAALAKGDWKDFNRRMVELAPVVNRTAQAYKNIRAEQRRQVLRQSKNLDFMAEDGDIIDRLNRDKMLETKFRKATGARLTPDDFKKFEEDSIHSAESTIEVVFMIDGSGSMPMVKLANGVTAMEAALQSAAIGYMACRKAGIDAYIVMWGDAVPLVVATPESNPREVGAKLETLRNGTRSGTDLAPGIITTIGSMADHRNKNGTVSGTSHMLIFSDGDIFDKPESIKALETVSRKGKNISIDVAVLNNRGEGQTEMEKVFKGVIDRTGGRILGILHGNDPQRIPLDLAQLMLRRVRNVKVRSEADSVKRKELKKLHRDLTNK